MFDPYNPYSQSPYYSGTGYSYPQTQPQMNQMQVMPQTQMPQQNQFQTQMTQNPSIMYVNNGYKGACEILIPPNTTKFIFDNDATNLYVKVSDGMGRATIRSYKQIDEGHGEPKKQEPEKTEIDDLKSKIKMYEEKLSEYDKKFTVYDGFFEKIKEKSEEIKQ